LCRGFAAWLLDVDMLGPTFGFVAIKNLGPGTALHVDLVLSFDPPAERWSGMNPFSSLASSITSSCFMPEQIRELQLAGDQGTVIRAKGQYEDVYGYAYSLDESFDIRAWWEPLIKAGHILRRYYKDRE